MLVDTHCHINFKEFKDDADEVLSKSLEQGISLIVPSVQKSTSQRAVDYADRYDGVWAAVGLHPLQLFDIKSKTESQEYYTRAEEFDYSFYKKLAGLDKVVAIGEVGLDYYHLPQEIDFGKVRLQQREVLLEQIKLARELDLPLIIHTRNGASSHDCYEDVLELLSQANYYNCVLHSFAGSLGQAREFITKGCYLSFNGIITFKKAIQIREIAQAISLDSILLETDAPYLAPEPHRGQRNEPKFVKYVAAKIAEIKGISLEEVAQVSTRNAVEFFKLK